MSGKLKEEITSKFNELSNNYDRNKQYFDILYDSTSLTAIRKSKSDESISINNNKSGIVARTYIGHWKEIAIKNIEDIKKIESKLPKSSQKDNSLKRFESWKLDKKVETKIDPTSISLEEKIEKIREIYKFYEKYDDRIVNPTVGYVEMITTRIFVNNEGSELKQEIPRIRVFIQPLAKEGKNIDFDYLSIGGEMGYEIMDKVECKLEETAENSLKMLEAEPAPSGKYPIILDPDMAGLIAHESFGHGLEADQVLRDRSYLKPLINKPVASEICNIYDSPGISHALGFCFFDDEGIRSDRNKLVENGILKNFIHNRITASALDAEPKGNGRRESYAHPLHVRMTNTYFEPGDQSLEEMIEDINYGVILNRGYFGMEDPLGGGLQVTSKKGYLIENGEKTKLLKATALSGSVLDLLKNIDAVSDNELKLKPGTCGKGYEDFVPVTSGGSYLRVKKALISPG